MKDHTGISGHLNGRKRTTQFSTELTDEHGYLKASEHKSHVADYSRSNEKEAKDLCAARGMHIELSREDSTVYTDKNILETDQPELIVYKDSTVYAVKDICVDEGVHTESKCLAESVVGGRSTLPSNNCKHIYLAKEANTDIAFEDGFKSSSYKECREGAAAADCASKSEVNLIKDTAYDSDAGLESSLESGKHEAFASAHSPESHRKTSLKCLLDSSKFGENNSSQGSDEIGSVLSRLS